MHTQNTHTIVSLHSILNFPWYLNSNAISNSKYFRWYFCGQESHQHTWRNINRQRVRTTVGEMRLGEIMEVLSPLPCHLWLWGGHTGSRVCRWLCEEQRAALGMTGVLMANSKQAAQREKRKSLNFDPEAENHCTQNTQSAVGARSYCVIFQILTLHVLLIR